MQSSIEIIFEQEELVQRSKELTEGVRSSLGQRSREASTLIKILNLKTKDELVEFEIAVRIETILEVSRVLTKRNLLVQMENK